MPVFFPFVNAPAMSLARIVARILQTPLATVQHAGEPSLRLSISTVVQAPSGQSSVVKRSDSEIHSVSLSQNPLRPFADALNFTPCVASSGLPTTVIVSLPEPVGERAHPKAAAGAVGAQAEAEFPAWVAVLGDGAEQPMLPR